MKVAMLGSYPASSFKDKLKLSKLIRSHPSTWIVNLNRGLVKVPDIELHMITRVKGLTADQIIKSNGITYHFLVQRPKGEYSKMLSLFQLDRIRIHRELRAIDPDMIHSHGTENVYSYAAVTSGYPCVVSLQGIIDKVMKHETDKRARLTMTLIKCFERYTIKKAKYIISKVLCTKKWALEVNPNLKVFNIEDPVNEAFFNAKNLEEKNTILFIGTILKRKGIEDLLKSIYLLKNEFDDIKLLIIGWGNPDYISKIRKFVKEKELEKNVNLLGFKESTEVAAELFKSCVLVLPSYIESNSNVISEAMAAGKPVIATRVGGIPYKVRDGQTGLLVDAGNIDGLTRKISMLLRSKDLRIKMGENAKEEALRRFRPDIIAQKHMQAYKEVIKNWR